MEFTKSVIAQFGQLAFFYIQSIQQTFNNILKPFDFGFFCIIYTLVFMFVLVKINKGANYRPQTIELLDWKIKIKKAAKKYIYSLPIIKTYVEKKFQEALSQIETEIKRQNEVNRDKRKCKILLEQPMPTQKISQIITDWSQAENERMYSGKISGSTYIEHHKISDQINNFAAKYMYHNPLHLDTYKQLSRMQSQLLSMTGKQISNKRVFGVITSGGSQSLIMSIYAYRQFYKNKKQPNIVVPNSIHAAIEKGAMYFNVQVRKAKLDKDFVVDLNHMRQLIDSNTIAIYGSYPNYPHGIIDPIFQIGKLAKKFNIGFHIDACLGGFIAAFIKQHQSKCTLDIEGATSISLDHHKFGLAPKGISCILFKHRKHRRAMYYVNTDWIGGVYATPSFPGSRSGFASAGAWYALTYLGKNVYEQNAKRVQKATLLAIQKLQQVKGIKIIGKPQLCALAFYSTDIDCFSISSFLGKQRGWKISPLHLPNALHLSVTIANCDNIVNKLPNDVRDAIQFIKSQPKKQNTTAAVYGASQTLPNQEMSDQMIRKFISTGYK